MVGGHRVPAMDAIRDLTEYMQCLRPPRGSRPPDRFEWLVIELIDEAMSMLAVGKVGHRVRPPRQRRSGAAAGDEAPGSTAGELGARVTHEPGRMVHGSRSGSGA